MTIMGVAEVGRGVKQQDLLPLNDATAIDHLDILVLHSALSAADPQRKPHRPDRPGIRAAHGDGRFPLVHTVVGARQADCGRAWGHENGAYTGFHENSQVQQVYAGRDLIAPRWYCCIESGMSHSLFHPPRRRAIA